MTIEGSHSILDVVCTWFCINLWLSLLGHEDAICLIVRRRMDILIMVYLFMNVLSWCLLTTWSCRRIFKRMNYAVGWRISQMQFMRFWKNWKCQWKLHLDWELDYGVVLYCDVIVYECKCEISYALKRFMNEHSDVYNFQMSCLPIWGIERLWPG